MARAHAIVHATIWSDSDFTGLPTGAQRLYLLLLSQPDLTLCGSIAYRPKLWARLAPDTTVDDIEEAIAALEDARFVLVDRDVDELLVRTLIRWDPVLRHPNMAKSMARAWGALASQRLRDAVVAELPEHVRPGFPGQVLAMTPAQLGRFLRGETTDPDPDPSTNSSRPVDNPARKAATNTRNNPPRKGSPKGSRNPSRNPSFNASRKGRVESGEWREEVVSTSSRHQRDDDDPITNPHTGELIPGALPTVGDGLTPAHLWTEMARRRWHLEHEAGRQPPPAGPRRTRWLTTTAEALAAEHTHRVHQVLADTLPGTPADTVIWRLDPTLALRDWSIPDTPPPDDPPGDRASPDEARRHAARIRAQLRRTQETHP